MKTNRTFHPLLVLATAAGMGLATTSAMAQPWQIDRNQFSFSNSHSVVDGNIVDVQVRVSGGQAPLFFKPGTSDRHYFQAFQGRNYSLVIRNTTGKRVGVLIAVDGLNVVNGQRSALDRHEPMYVLGPWESAEIQGWRSSLSNVRKFVFVDEQRSYAERTGQANGDMGWIRVIAYREVQRQPLWGNWSRGDDQRSQNERGKEYGEVAPAPGMQDSKRSMSSQESAPGTGWGDREYDPVQQTSFEPMAWATDKIALRYEYASGLRALGIIISRRPRVFERDRGELGFAQPPPR